jgi:hypothetical protein
MLTEHDKTTNIAVLVKIDSLGSFHLKFRGHGHHEVAHAVVMPERVLLKTP